MSPCKLLPVLTAFIALSMAGCSSNNRTDATAFESYLSTMGLSTLSDEDKAQERNRFDKRYEQAITENTIAQYYESRQNDFTIKEQYLAYILLKVPDSANQQERDVANTLTVSLSKNVSQSAIDKEVGGLSIGKMSRIVFESDAPYIVQLLNIGQQPAKILTQARTEISKRFLLPASIKKSVTAISESHSPKLG